MAQEWIIPGGLLEQAWLTAVAVVACWALASGADDLYLLIAWAANIARLKRAFSPPPEDLPEKSIAVFVPLWREHRVIREMVEHNVSAIRYGEYEIFLGVYPNDGPTLEAAAELDARFANVHIALCPHPGPTSKADCLNWIYQRLLLFEESTSWRAAAVVVHDAEDVIHPDAFRWINHLLDRFDMVQIPVFPLPTPNGDLVHGVYCDEFAEYQCKDVPARMLLGGFIPSNGVGAGYRREALELLAERESNRVFDPEALTEDYENGYRIKRLGLRQVFLPPAFTGGSLLATREYFPRTWRAAIKQRTRWVTGIVLQGWERHGWKGSRRDLYFWWRDRKGLVGNPLSCLSNLLLIASPFCLRWEALPSLPPWAAAGAGVLLLFQSALLAARISASARIYGWRFAVLAPLRVPVASLINSAAAALALKRYLAARWAGEPLRWLKTDHRYPNRAAIAAARGFTLVSGAMYRHESCPDPRARRARSAAV